MMPEEGQHQIKFSSQMEIKCNFLNKKTQISMETKDKMKVQIL
jgi:hypothetical protein